MEEHYTLEELLIILGSDEVLAFCDEKETRKILSSAVNHSEALPINEWENLGLEMACGLFTEEEALALLEKYGASKDVIQTVEYEYTCLKDVEKIITSCVGCGQETKAQRRDENPLCHKCN